MLRAFAFASLLLLSTFVVGNARQITSTGDHGNATASAVRHLVGLIDITANASETPFLKGEASPALVLTEPTVSSRSLAVGAPEPGSLFLFGTGLVLIGVIRRVRVSR